MFSRNVAAAKSADAAAPAGAPAVMGFGDGGAGGDVWAAEPVRTLAAARMRKVADKVFYLKEDGFYYDSVFEEAMRDRILEIRYFSDEYFDLARTYGKRMSLYMVFDEPVLLTLDDQAYLIEP